MARHFSNRASIACLLVVVSVVGCGEGKVDVTGTASVAGESVDVGEIKFFSLSDGVELEAHVEIKDGRYFATLTPGEKEVRIVGYKMVGHRPDDAIPGGPIVGDRQLLTPDDDTKPVHLTVDGGGRHDFEL